MCFESRKCPAMIVGIFSVVALILGLLMVVLSVKFNTNDFATEVDALGDYQNTAFYMLLGGSLVAVGAGICGICVCLKKQMFCCNVITGLFLMIAFLFLFISGIVITGVSNTDE
jgi:hypothetical protein